MRAPVRTPWLISISPRSTRRTPSSPHRRDARNGRRGGPHQHEEPPSSSRTARVTALNGRFALVERRFLTAEGLPGRKWFRHCLQAPGLYTGYAPKTLPGVYDVTTTEDWDVAQAQADRAAQHIAAATSALNEPVAHAVAMDDM